MTCYLTVISWHIFSQFVLVFKPATLGPTCFLNPHTEIKAVCFCHRVLQDKMGELMEQVCEGKSKVNCWIGLRNTNRLECRNKRDDRFLNSNSISLLAHWWTISGSVVYFILFPWGQPLTCSHPSLLICLFFCSKTQSEPESWQLLCTLSWDMHSCIKKLLSGCQGGHFWPKCPWRELQILTGLSLSLSPP